MLGNVWEWVDDWYLEYSANQQTDPRGQSEGYTRLFRGGSWDNLSYYCRASFRIYANADYAYASVGFRAARTP
jgi:formylglycine-generating enzyme required for sulfatase activity